MPSVHDGPCSPHFRPVPLKGNVTLKQLARATVSDKMKEFARHAPSGRCTAWGLPFQIDRVILLQDAPVSAAVVRFKASWLVFMHTTDVEPLHWNRDGFISPTRGAGRLNEHVADYVICYADGSEARAQIRRRHHIGMISRGWGENCFQAVAHAKPYPVRAAHEQPPSPGKPVNWGWTQTRAASADFMPWVNWLWAWENPFPAKAIVALRFEPKQGAVIISGLSAGNASVMPLRWETRQKAVFRLPKGVAFDPNLDEKGRLKQIQLDMGQVISAIPRLAYPNDEWAKSYNNKLPEQRNNEILIEYTAHPDALFHLGSGKTVPVAKLKDAGKGPLTRVAPATQSVVLRVIEKSGGKPVAVKLHLHGEAGEYLAPVDRHRIPNTGWFEDYAPEFVHQGVHCCTYIPGETRIKLPLGRVYIEISKGFEIRPVRKVVHVLPRTKEITIVLDKVLPWRERGWVTADTHVHFLSPHTARLEGAGEGVNVVNLLASQWGELMTNAGDFDGTTLGSRESGSDGEYLVRVGTENRQHILGHISLLGYNGSVIAPMTTGGPDESALGDPVEILLTEWARQCRKQGGLVVLPHFPNPRVEHAASIISGDIDALEMTSWGNLYGGIDPYSLSDWYRYLNCGHFVPAVAGTDKMSATTAVGTVRTYARIEQDKPFDYGAWMAAVRAGHTFVTYGPLLEFTVEGRPPGAWIRLNRTGGTVQVEWRVASVTVPMSRVDLIISGAVHDSRRIHPKEDQGYWSVKIDKSSWLALLVRGHYRDKPEIIAAHSSPVMVPITNSPFFAAADAVTILEQIEGALAYLDVMGTRPETAAYKRMRLVLTSAHRKLHNQLHRRGWYHDHTPSTDHAEHH